MAKIEAVEAVNGPRDLEIEQCPMKRWLLEGDDVVEFGPWYMRLMDDATTEVRGTVLMMDAEGRVGTVYSSRLRQRRFRVMPVGFAVRVQNE